MKEYRVHFTVTISDTIIVNANNKEEAEEKANVLLSGFDRTDLIERIIDTYEVDYTELK